MKKLRLFILLLLTFTTPVFSQLVLEGSNEYGRIFDINYDDTIAGKLYAATMGNHIVVSENNGQTWALLYSFTQAGAIIKDLKLMPNQKLAFTVYNTNAYHSATIYVLDILSLGIVNTYTIPVPTTATSSNISAYDIYTTNPNIAIVQQYYEEGFAFKAKVYFTTDAGSSWSEIYDIADHFSIFPAHVAISPDNPQKLFIARMGGLVPEHLGGLLISQDAGITWEEKLPGIDFKPIAFHPTNPDNILIGTTVGSQTQDLYRSSDGGATWNPVSEHWAQSVSDAIISIKYNPTNGNNVIILAEKDIITSSDNLETLSFYHHASGITSPEGNHNYYYGTNASFNPFTLGEIFISANYFPLFTADGGATVTRVKQPFFASVGFTGLATAGGQSHLYYGAQNGFVHKDMTTLTQTPAFVTSLGAFTSWSAKFFMDPQVAGRTYNFVSGMFGAALNISNDHGATNIQVPIPFPFMDAIATKPGHPNLIWLVATDYMGVSSLIELNISDPANVQQQIIALPDDGYISALYFTPSHPDEKWIALGSQLYKMTGEGAEWALIGVGLESLQSGMGRIFQIVQNPLATNEMALATSEGIFTSQDGGTTWGHLDTFPSEGVNLIGYSPLSLGQVVAVTYDTEFTNFALRYSADAGQSWNEVSAANLAHITAYSAAMQFGAHTATLYLSTTDLGVVSHTVNFTQLSTPEIATSENFLTVYPNPVHDYISLQLKNESVLRTTIFSVTGQKILESKDTQINVSTLERGLYFVKIKTISGKTTTQRFIKN